MYGVHRTYLVRHTFCTLYMRICGHVQLYDTLLSQKILKKIKQKYTFSFCSVDRCDATLALGRHH